MTSTRSALPADSGFLQDNDPTGAAIDATIPFRSLLPRPHHPRIAGIETHDAHTWCGSRRQVSAPAWLIDRLHLDNLEKPYVGFSADGNPDGGLWTYQKDEGAPVEAAVQATGRLLGILSSAEKLAVIKGDVGIDDEYRAWSNPELYMNPGGIRLDETRAEVRDAVHEILRTSLSPAGYEKALGCTLTNGFLGELVNGHRVLNKHSYNFRLFLPEEGPREERTPSQTAPWGWSFFGHHLCLNVMFIGQIMVIAPTFSGAEPDAIDAGPHAGLRLFKEEEEYSLKLMQSLSPDIQKKAQLSIGMTPQEGLPEDRWNPFDERHLGGARQDNRTVPYEGCPVSAFSQEQKSMLYQLLRAFNAYLPAAPLEHQLTRLRQYEDQMYFAWIGKFGDKDPYYYRIHSPVTFCEFDFHCGIFLTNTRPAKCHIHTINRFPNTGDYGKALIRQWKSAQGPAHREEIL